MSIGAYTPFFFVSLSTTIFFLFSRFCYCRCSINCLYKQCPEIDFYSEAITQETHIHCVAYTFDDDLKKKKEEKCRKMKTLE